MKLLKFTSPFGGKKYPLYVVIGIFLVVTTGCMFSTDLPISSVLELTALFSAIALFLCFYFERRLTAEEEAICSSMLPPLWEPVTPEVLALLSEDSSHFSRGSVTVCATAFVIGISNLSPKHGEPNMGITVLCGVVIGAVCLWELYRSIHWRSAGAEAQFTVVPIDHMYDVTHHSRRGRTWEESYLVFYQPDGKYVLHAKDGSGNAGAVAVVKYRGLVTWVPYPLNSQRAKDMYLY